MAWDPQVEQRPHPFGEAGVRSSLEEVCKRAAHGASEILSNPKHLARVRTWVGKKLKEAQQRGEAFSTAGDRAKILLTVVQNEKIWMPDPIGIEYIPAAHLMACDGDTHEDGTPCVQAEDCDGKTVLLAACFMAAGLYTMIVGHSYARNKVIGHVLAKVYFNGKWHYADPSPLGNGKYMPLGKCSPYTRERYYSMPTIKVVCDAASCDVRNFDPQEMGFVEQGTFVGVNGIAVEEMPPPEPRVQWLGQVEWIEDSSQVEWLGTSVGLLEKYSTKLGYMGLNKATDAVTSNILDSGGSTPFQSYAQTAGAAGGSAICAPYGPLASSLCGAVGGTIASILAGGLFKSTEEKWQTPGEWNSVVKWIRIGQEGVASIRGYLTQRDFYLDWVAGDAVGTKRDEALAWANAWLIKNGLPAAPIDPRWVPRKDFWDTYKAVEKWSHQPGVWPPFQKGTGKNAAGQPTSSYYTQSNGVGGWCQLANALKTPGTNCSSVILSTLYLGGPPAAPETAIDWGMVGAFQIASVPQISGQHLVVIPNTSSPVGGTAVASKSVLEYHKKF